MDRLTWRNERGQACFRMGDTEYVGGETAERLAEFEDAEEQGRHIIAPCPIGTMLWCAESIMPDWAKVLYFGQGFFECRTARSIFVAGKWQRTKSILFEDFGKTVFLTPEAAESALKAKSTGGD